MTSRIFFCLYRIAFMSKNHADIKAALDASAKVSRPGIMDDATFQKTIDWLKENQ